MLGLHREPVLTCPGPYEGVVVGVSWEAGIGQVEQRRSLSLLDHGTLRAGPAVPVPIRSFT